MIIHHFFQTENKTHQICSGIKVTCSFMMNCNVIIRVHVCNWFTHQNDKLYGIMTIPFLPCISYYSTLMYPNLYVQEVKSGSQESSDSKHRQNTRRNCEERSRKDDTCHTHLVLSALFPLSCTLAPDEDVNTLAS